MLSATLPVGHVARPNGDRYLTPQWAWKWLLSLWTPNPGTIIYDPAAGGWNGSSIGSEAAKLHNRQSRLADIDPLHASIETQDYLLAQPRHVQCYSIITNPPYDDLLELFLRKALKDCGHAGEVVFLIPYLWLMDSGRLDFPEPTHIWQARKRYEFELTPQDYQARLKAGKSCKVSKVSSTGYSMGSPGGAHVWVRWTPRNTQGTIWIRKPA